MNYGIIDIGSNTVRLSIYECQDREIKILFNKKTTAGLAGYVIDGALSSEGIERCIGVLLSYRSIISIFKLEGLSVFATASLRNIKNTDEAVRQIEERTGFHIDVILGQEEAVLDFVGATHALPLENGLVVDIGGGSIELVSFEQRKVGEAASIDVGSLSLYSQYVDGLFPTKEERKEIKAAVLCKLESLSPFKGVSAESVCGVGGTIRGACKLYNKENRMPMENRQFPAENIKKLLGYYKSPDKKALELILKTVPDRIHTILPGMLALQVILDYFSVETVYVSSFGVREGYLYQNILEKGITDGRQKEV